MPPRATTSGFSLVEVMVAAALLSLVLAGGFAATQLVDKSASNAREHARNQNWHFASFQAKTLTIVRAEADSADGNWAVVNTSAPEGCLLRERLTVFAGSPNTFLLSSELSWEGPSQTSHLHQLSSLLYLP